MPNKYPEKKGWELPKHKYKVSNWSHYNDALRKRGDLDVWISADIAEAWYESDRVNNGTGAPKKFTDLAIITCHEIRQVFKLALRQCQGFINSIFKTKKIRARSPDYSCLSKRLAKLDIKSPHNKQKKDNNEEVCAIAIDSTGLKRFGRGEWQQDKYKLSGKRSWRKLHIAVDTTHIIHASELTDRFTHDCKSVEPLAKQITCSVDHITADGAYDKNAVYETLTEYFKDATVIIPPGRDSAYNKNNHAKRNQSLLEIKTFGRMAWQRVQNYGRRNYSELAMLRYKKILGNRLHARELSRQKNESMIGCGILNKMTFLGMPTSYRCA